MAVISESVCLFKEHDHELILAISRQFLFNTGSTIAHRGGNYNHEEREDSLFTSSKLPAEIHTVKTREEGTEGIAIVVSCILDEVIQTKFLEGN